MRYSYQMACIVLFVFSWTKANAQSLERFEPYKDNDVLVYQGTEGDQDALQANYSFKYSIFQCTDQDGLLTTYLCPEGEEGGLNFFFAYTGSFDFYMYENSRGLRASKPVINRLNNPSVHINWNNTNLSEQIEWWGIGVEHRSNGQVVSADEKDATGQFVTQVMYLKLQHEYFDALSRSGNYVTIGFGGKGITENGKFSVGLKNYILKGSEESNITWGALAGKDTDFSDYDMLTLSLFERIDVFSLNRFWGEDNKENLGIGIDFTMGKKGIKESSVDVKVTMLWNALEGAWNAPIFFKLHYGPMERLSDYSASYTSFGVGVDFGY